MYGLHRCSWNKRECLRDLLCGRLKDEAIIMGRPGLYDPLEYVAGVALVPDAWREAIVAHAFGHYAAAAAECLCDPE